MSTSNTTSKFKGSVFSPADGVVVNKLDDMNSPAAVCSIVQDEAGESLYVHASSGIGSVVRTGDKLAESPVVFTPTDNLSSCVDGLWYVNISNKTSFSYRKTNGWMLRRTAINSNTPLITNIKCAKLYINAVCNHLEGYKSVKGVDSVVSLNRYKGKSVEEYYNNLEKQELAKPGFIQSFSVLPSSYPGHSLLTEDIGISYGIDDCSCGKKGRYFKVLGRLKKSELRGCSDVY